MRKGKAKLFLGLICGLLLFVSTVALGRTSVPLLEQDRIALWSHLRTLPDPQGEYSPAQVFARIEEGAGGILAHADQSYGNWLPYPYWAAFELTNPLNQPQNRVLSFEVPTQDHTDLWIQTRKAGNVFQNGFSSSL